MRTTHAELQQKKHEEKLRVVNRRDIRKQKMKQIRQLQRRQRALLIAMLLGRSMVVWRDRLEKERRRRAAQKEVASAASRIQRKWNKQKRQKKGRRVRNAIKIIRRTCLALAFTRRARKKADAADMLVSFLRQYENANFIKIMRNYRYKVIQCQRCVKNAMK